VWFCKLLNILSDKLYIIKLFQKLIYVLDELLDIQTVEQNLNNTVVFITINVDTCNILHV